MAVLPIRITGESVLHGVALPVTSFDASLEQLVNDMFDTMREAPGVGLAAPQVGLNQRLFVYHWTDDDGTLHHGVAVNPQLWLSPTPIGDPDDDDDSEGCLSLPGERFPLRRAERAVLSAVDQHGVAFEVRAEGWLARIFQHEYDHLEGILYVDRLAHRHAKAAAKAVKRNNWGVAGLSWMPGLDHPED